VVDVRRAATSWQHEIPRLLAPPRTTPVCLAERRLGKVPEAECEASRALVPQILRGVVLGPAANRLCNGYYPPPVFH